MDLKMYISQIDKRDCLNKLTKQVNCGIIIID